MELGLRGRALNPDLENIRNRVLYECAVRNNNNEWIKQLINKTSTIHAGFLFEDEKSLQDLCLFIGETQNKITDSGWRAFGYHLGLNPCVLKVINHNNFNKEDPTYNVLLAFVQFDSATIGTIIQALLDIGRLDIIHRIKDSINGLADIILQHKNNFNCNSSSGETSDYGSMQMSNERNNLSCGSNSSSNENSSSQSGNVKDIIKPAVVPPAPFIFQNIKADPRLTSQRIQQSLEIRDSVVCETEIRREIKKCRVSYVQNSANMNHVTVPDASVNYQSSANANSGGDNVTANKTKRYGKIVMLTFGNDGERYVKDICKILRRERDYTPRIGVLVLSEHQDKVLTDPHRFITGSFHQVDYVCPILTQSYFDLIMRKEKSTNFSDLHLDARYVQYIYTLMNNYYISNGCLNDKIRCIIPDDLMSQVQCNLFMSVPIFGAWVKLSEVEEMAVRLLRSNI